MNEYPPDLKIWIWLRLWIVTGMLSLSLAPAFALTWEKTLLDLSLATSATDLISEFPFKNEGMAPVTISELKSSCGCAVPTVESKVIPAGSTAVVKVVYTPGDRVGQQSVQLIVRTDEKNVSPALLRLRVNIEPSLFFNLRLVHWAQSEETVVQKIDIKKTGAAKVTIVSVKPTEKTIVTELRPGAMASEWQLLLTPISKTNSFSTKIEVVTLVGSRKTTYTLYGVRR